MAERFAFRALTEGGGTLKPSLPETIRFRLETIGSIPSSIKYAILCGHHQKAGLNLLNSLVWKPVGAYYW